MSKDTLRVHSIFKSISGEVGLIPQGAVTVFLRLAGCNMKCDYCDTKHTQSRQSGKQMSISSVARQIEDHKCKNLIITGGEPLLQKQAIIKLIDYFSDEDFNIQIETNGTKNINWFCKTIVPCFVVDFKLKAGAAYDKEFGARIMSYIHLYDWIKFVCEDLSDYKKARKLFHKWDKQYSGHLRMAFSAVNSDWFSSKELAKLMVADNLRAVLNVQIHKLIDAE